MSVPIQIPWDLYLGKLVVWCETVAAGVRRAVLLPRLDTIFAPRQSDPARETPYGALDWRLVSPREEDWEKYRRMVEKQVERHGIRFRMQRVENMAEWVGGRKVVVPQYHIWLYRDVAAADDIERLYSESEPAARRRLWRALLSWNTSSEPEPQKRTERNEDGYD